MSPPDNWETPDDVLDRVRAVLGDIDLDPASSERANERVRAKQFFSATVATDGLTRPWEPAATVFINPPSGVSVGVKKPRAFWERLMRYREHPCFRHAIFLCFNLGALRVLQGNLGSPTDFPLCIPRRRIAFVPPAGVGASTPRYDNAIVYVASPTSGPTRGAEAFVHAFSSLGACVVPR